MTTTRGRPGPGQDKRRALLDGALAVFACDGYTRGSVDAIARAGGVSTRTIYNQFGDKATLFEAVIVDSAERVAAAQIVIVQRYLGRIVDVEADLREFGRIWATWDEEWIPHFRLVRQVIAEAGHVPVAALRAWQEAGPLRVRREIAAHLARIAAAGHLTLPDPELAAVHLVQLVAGEATSRSYYGAVTLPPAEVRRLADAGVAAFLDGYRARSGAGDGGDHG